MVLCGKNYKRAFTLVELCIAMAVFAIIAALVISFMVFLIKFTNANNKETDRYAHFTELRAEIDFWFSYFDNADYTVTIGSSDNTENSSNVVVLATASWNESGETQLDGSLAAYHLWVMEWNDGEVRALVSSYPYSAEHGTAATFDGDGNIVTDPSSAFDELYSAKRNAIVCGDSIFSFEQYTSSDSEENESSDSEEISGNYLRFLITLRVADEQYACTITY